MKSISRIILYSIWVVALGACGFVDEAAPVTPSPALELLPSATRMLATPTPRATKSGPIATETSTITPTSPPTNAAAADTAMPSERNCPEVVANLDITDQINVLYYNERDYELWRIDPLINTSQEIAQFSEDVYPLLDPGGKVVSWYVHETGSFTLYDLTNNRVRFTKTLPESHLARNVGWTSNGEIQYLADEKLLDPPNNFKILSRDFVILDPNSGAMLETRSRNYDLPGAYVSLDNYFPNLFFAAFQPSGRHVLYNRSPIPPDVEYVVLWDAQRNEIVWESEPYRSVRSPYNAIADELWSPEGDKVAFIADSAVDNSAATYILSAETKTLLSIPGPDSVFDAYIPYLRWSPDSRYLHFMGWEYPRSKYVQNGYLVDIDRQEYKMICHPVSSFISGTFVTNRFLLFLGSPDENTSEIWLLDVDAWKMVMLSTLDLPVNEITVLGPGVSLHDY